MNFLCFVSVLFCLHLFSDGSSSFQVVATRARWFQLVPQVSIYVFLSFIHVKITVQWQCPLCNCPLDNLPITFSHTITPWTTTPRTFSPTNLPQDNCPPGFLPPDNLPWIFSPLDNYWKLFRVEPFWVLAKRVLQLGMIVNPSLEMWPSSIFFHWCCVTESRTFFQQRSELISRGSSSRLP